MRMEAEFTEVGWEDEEVQRKGNPGRGGLWICLGKRVLWISGEEKVILNKRDRTSTSSWVSRKKPIAGYMTGTIGCLG